MCRTTAMFYLYSYLCEGGIISVEISCKEVIIAVVALFFSYVLSCTCILGSFQYGTVWYALPMHVFNLLLAPQVYSFKSTLYFIYTWSVR